MAFLNNQISSADIVRNNQAIRELDKLHQLQSMATISAIRNNNNNSKNTAWNSSNDDREATLDFNTANKLNAQAMLKFGSGYS